MTGAQPISFPARLRALARERPDAPALRFLGADGTRRESTWRDLDAWTERLARGLVGLGVGPRSTVAVGLRNVPEHVAITMAAWKVGALVLPLRPALPAHERDALLALAAPTIVVSEWDGVEAHPHLHLADLEGIERHAGPALPDVVPNPGRAIGSGGSTGRSKLIISLEPLQAVPLQRGEWGPPGRTMRLGQRQLVAGPLYHVAPFFWMHVGFFQGHEVTLLERFDPRVVRAEIGDHGIEWAFLSPTMLRRLTPFLEPDDAWLSTIEGAYASGGPFPAWLMSAWAQRLGRRLVERYGGAEDVGLTEIDGVDALAHPGSVGRPVDAEVRIVAEDGTPAAPGDVGAIYLRRTDTHRPASRYIGAPPLQTVGDGFATIGDLGWLDADGYLYLADRRTDLIVSGDVNVYPAEVEGRLHEHPAVAEAVVVGLPDETWGQRVHAIIQLRPGTGATATDLDRHCRAHLAGYQCPKTYDFVSALPRDDIGKIRRSALAAERATWDASTFAGPHLPDRTEPPGAGRPGCLGGPVRPDRPEATR